MSEESAQGKSYPKVSKVDDGDMETRRNPSISAGKFIKNNNNKETKLKWSLYEERNYVTKLNKSLLIKESK